MPVNRHSLSSRRLVARLGRLYALILWLFPRRFRLSYGAEMRQVFESRMMAGLISSGRAGVRAVVWREAADLPRAILRAYAYGVCFGWMRFAQACRENFDASRPSLFRVPGWGVLLALVLPVALVVSAFSFRFRALPYTDAQRLVTSTRALPLWSKARRGFGYSFAEWHEFQTCYQSMAAFAVRLFPDPSPDEPARKLRTLLVSPEFFNVLGVEPRAGSLRRFHAASGAGLPPVVVSNAFWRKRLGSGKNAIGREITIDGRAMTVAAVMPPRFWFFDPNIEIWAPVDNWAAARPYVRMVARLAQGNTLADADFDVRLIWYSVPMGLERITTSAYSRLAYAFAAMIIAWILALTLARLRQPYRLLRPNSLRRRYAASFAFVSAESLLACAAASSLWLAGQEIVNPTWPWLAPFPSILLLVWANGAAVWWSLAEHKTRCLNCLRSLRMPVPLGRIGSVLLDSPSTEHICIQGHGILREPEPLPSGIERATWKESGTIWDELVSPPNGN